jgi:hypothetical protein
MADITQQQVIEAAQGLGKAEFNRQDIATALGVEKSDVKQAFTQARKAGYFEKVRDDDENTGIFKLGAKAAAGGGGDATAASGAGTEQGAAPTPPAEGEAGDSGVIGEQVDR